MNDYSKYPKDRNQKAYWGVKATYKYLPATNTKGSRFRLTIGDENIGIFPYDYSKHPSEQLAERLQEHFLCWNSCIITNDKDGYVAMITMGTEL